MQKYTHFENLIFGFCRLHRVGMIQPDEKLHYVLYIDDIEVRCFSAASSIYLQVELGPLPDSHASRVARSKYIMQQSLFDAVDSQCVVSLNGRDRLTIYQKLSIDRCQLSDFEASMAELANQVDAYNEILSQAT